MEPQGYGLINNRAALRALTLEYARLQDEMLEGFLVKLVDDNYFLWEVGIFGPPDTLYEGGYFRAELCFPPDYPFEPPTMTFLTKIWHPNIYRTGKVCISILTPTTQGFGENPAERWNPTQNVRTILLSVISLLNEPNIMSPANGMAAFWYRRHCETSGTDTKYREAIQKLVSESKEYALEKGIKVPTTREEYCVRQRPESTAEENPVYDEKTFLLFGCDSEDDMEEEEDEVKEKEGEEKEEGVENEEIEMECDQEADEEQKAGEQKKEQVPEQEKTEDLSA